MSNPPSPNGFWSSVMRGLSGSVVLDLLDDARTQLPLQELRTADPVVGIGVVASRRVVGGGGLLLGDGRSE